MTDYNKVLLIGRLTRDLELKYTQSNVPVVVAGFAINREVDGENGQQQTKVCFVDILIWRALAVTASRKLKKGSEILVEGYLDLKTWKQADGEKRSKLRVVAELIKPLGSKQESLDFARELTLQNNLARDIDA